MLFDYISNFKVSQIICRKGKNMTQTVFARTFSSQLRLKHGSIKGGSAYRVGGGTLFISMKVAHEAI